MISVITPVYNGENFIEQCIKVVIDQKSSSDIEHIIVDGSSTDKTVEIIRYYAEKFSHIRWISESDKGQSDAINKGIMMARGEILSILNVDDYYEPNVLKTVEQIFQNLPQPTLLVGNCNVWDDYNHLLYVNKPERLQFNELLLGPSVNPFPCNPSAYFYHKSLHEKIGLYDLNEHYAMDLHFILKSVQVAKVKYINEVLGNFRLIDGTKTKSDQMNGQINRRVEAILNNYISDLSLPEKLRFYFKKYKLLTNKFVDGKIRTFFWRIKHKTKQLFSTKSSP
jgi:glycosyltransferase involved in cell wall biosynthesis